ncbi:heme exporter protein D [Primorskyibacter flagellatus]|uniref:Heme exporter protein D n=2 Tax=Primorskyibacter flagellatus TaxID=1387277 RepID=A0A1W1Z1B4_9RHOB|nr:heme exporter protein D [Primorskyibacter flagellatus]
MPDLGKYADVVLSSYAVSILLIVALVGVSFWRARRVKAELDRVETRGTRRG